MLKASFTPPYDSSNNQRSGNVRTVVRNIAKPLATEVSHWANNLNPASGRVVAVGVFGASLINPFLMPVGVLGGILAENRLPQLASKISRFVNSKLRG